MLMTRPQTVTVLRQAWMERLKPLLVINKLDRLIVELKLSPSEAYHHLSQLIEQVNAVMGSFFASERMEDDLRWREERDRRLQEKKEAISEALADEANAADGLEQPFEERDDEDIYFDPAKGDVLFASAVDAWAFRVSRFAQIWAKKLGIREAILNRCLWGDFYLDPKTKRVLSKKHVGKRNLKPMFVQFVLDNIWAAYDAIVINPYVLLCLAPAALPTRPSPVTKSRPKRSSVPSSSRSDRKISSPETLASSSPPSAASGCPSHPQRSVPSSKRYPRPRPPRSPGYPRCSTRTCRLRNQPSRRPRL